MGAGTNLLHAAVIHGMAMNNHYRHAASSFRHRVLYILLSATRIRAKAGESLTELLCSCAAGTSSFQSLATPAIPDPIGTLLNQNTNYANIISSAHPDPVPSNLVNQLVENPLGPQLDAAFKALPSVQVFPHPRRHVTAP